MRVSTGIYIVMTNTICYAEDFDSRVTWFLRLLSVQCPHGFCFAAVGYLSVLPYLVTWYECVLLDLLQICKEHCVSTCLGPSQDRETYGYCHGCPMLYLGTQQIHSNGWKWVDS
jgi:hypothetical protein